jgi:asparagine synthase (glutamine-hydrolysing)
MCGFVGVAGLRSVEERSWLSPACDALAHRGPDDFGQWWSDDFRVGLGHRRLSIVDLSTHGRQPMHISHKKLSIVFNGEIYNFRELREELIKLGYNFKSGSDTEVLLAAYDAWGDECLPRLNGMFAFAIYDGRREKIFLARDRAGEKPFFYKINETGIQFASELKALLANPNNSRQINYEALDCLLALGFIPGNMCIFEGYKKLPPAHAMEVDLRDGSTKCWQYWVLPEQNLGQPLKGKAELLDELEHLLEDAVARQMIADVPVGILLSGGVDSSLVTALAVRSSTRVKTFTVGFPRSGRFDETQHARLVAEYFGTEHIELMADEATVDVLPLLARQYDEPIIDSSMIPTFLVSKLVREHCTVALGGDGGDELFGGYQHYSRLLWMQRRLSLLPHFFRKSLSHAGETFLPVGFRGRNWIQALGEDVVNGVPWIARVFDERTRRQLLGGALDGAQVAARIRESRIVANPHLLERATRTDFTNYLPEDILVKVDRASMLNSLEMRAPFLDHKLLNFAFRDVPSKLKATEFDRKILLKDLAARLLPAEFDKQRKQGFSIPMQEWLKGGAFKDYFYDILCDSKCSFDSATVKNLLRGQEKGRQNGERLFALVMIESWKREYQIDI